MASFLDKLQSMQDVNKGKSAEQKKYDDLVRANKVLGVAGMAAPPVVGMGLQALTDMQIDQMEKKNPSLAPKNPFAPSARNRFSTVGQVLMGYGYPSQPGIAVPSVGERISNILGGGGGPDPKTTIWNARGDIMSIPGGGGQPQSSPSSRNYNLNDGGRESAVSYDDYSGYA